MMCLKLHSALAGCSRPLAREPRVSLGGWRWRRRRWVEDGVHVRAHCFRQRNFAASDGVEFAVREHSRGSSVVGLAHDLLQLAGGYVAFVGGGRSKGIKTAIIAFTTRPPVTVSSSSSRSSRGSALVLLMIFLRSDRRPIQSLASPHWLNALGATVNRVTFVNHA